MIAEYLSVPPMRVLAMAGHLSPLKREPATQWSDPVPHSEGNGEACAQPQ